MALEPETREIDGHVYVYTPLGAKASMRLFTQIVQRLGDSVGQALAAVQGDAGQAEIGGNAIGALCEKLDPDFVEQLIETLARQTRVEYPSEGGESKLLSLKDVYDLHFSRRMFSQFQWMAWCLSTQYTDFLGWLRQAVSNKNARLPAPPKGG